MTDFKPAFYGLRKKESYELDNVINEFDTFDGTGFATIANITSALTPYSTTAAMNTAISTALTPYAKIVSAPTSATATGTAGQIAYDATNIYVCVATNTWVKATLATWT